jgi:hypothetical protein
LPLTRSEFSEVVIQKFLKEKEIQIINKKLGKCTEKIRYLKKKTLDGELSIADLVKQN